MSTALEKDVVIAEYARVVFAHTPALATKYEDLLDPAYWANVAHKFKPTCRVEVLAEDLSWYAELVVISNSRTWAKMAPLHYVKLTATKKPAKESDLDHDVKGYDISFAGQVKKYRVVRKSDKVEIRDGIPTEEEANIWLKNHVKALSN